jgi:hypothetical protein
MNRREAVMEEELRKLAHQMKIDTIEACAKIAESYPAGFGSEHEASGLIRKGQNDAARTIAERLRDMASN